MVFLTESNYISCVSLSLYFGRWGFSVGLLIENNLLNRSMIFFSVGIGFLSIRGTSLPLSKLWCKPLFTTIPIQGDRLPKWGCSGSAG